LYVAKISSGGEWRWATEAGGAFYDIVTSIAIDSSDNAYITGKFNGRIFFGETHYTTDSIVLDNNGGDDYAFFLAKIGSNGKWLSAISPVSGEGNAGGKGIAIDSDDNIYITGYFTETCSIGGTALTSYGKSDAFVAKKGSSGDWEWTKSLGGSDYDSVSGVTVDENGNVYLTGYFTGTASFGDTNLSSSGSLDIFVTKFNSNGDWQYAMRAGGTGDDQGKSISVDSRGNVYITGEFSKTSDFDGTKLSAEEDGARFVSRIDSGWLPRDSSAGLNMTLFIFFGCSILLAIPLGFIMWRKSKNEDDGGAEPTRRISRSTLRSSQQALLPQAQPPRIQILQATQSGGSHHSDSDPDVVQQMGPQMSPSGVGQPSMRNQMGPTGGSPMIGGPTRQPRGPQFGRGPPPPNPNEFGVVGQDGFEWLQREDGHWYRPANRGLNWARWNG
jgi:hypothetical protein